MAKITFQHADLDFEMSQAWWLVTNVIEYVFRVRFGVGLLDGGAAACF